jgi:hypothetical protein
MVMRDDDWPAVPLDGWKDTCATFHMWTQIVGKIRLRRMPWWNHSWHTTLYVTPRGLSTSSIPYGSGSFQVDFDLVDHQLVVQKSDGTVFRMQLESQTVADFYADLMDGLQRMGIPVRIHGKPNEVEAPIPFARDTIHRSYDPEAVHRFWRALVQTDRVFKVFRGGFLGKCSPVHLFFGAFDLAVTRFSGRRAPLHPGGVPNLPDSITQEAYSHEVSSCGFWPGSGAVPYPAYYSYAYPEPPGFAGASVKPAEAFYSPEFREFVLPYDAVRQSADPDGTLLGFLQSTYDAAADLARWNRSELEKPQ